MTVDEAIKALSEAGLVVERMDDADQRILGGIAQQNADGSAGHTGAFTISSSGAVWNLISSTGSANNPEVFNSLEAAVRSVCERLGPT